MANHGKLAGGSRSDSRADWPNHGSNQTSGGRLGDGEGAGTSRNNILCVKGVKRADGSLS